MSAEPRKMTDQEAYDFHAGPANRAAGPARGLPRRPLSKHVPVRFPPAMIEAVKEIAFEQHMTVSSWIRREVTRAVQRERSNHGNPRTSSSGGEIEWDR